MSLPEITMQGVLKNMGTNIKRDIYCFRIGKILAKNQNNTYNIQLSNKLKKNDTIIEQQILENIHPIKEGIKGKSIKIEYTAGEYVVVGFFDISYEDWFNGQEVLIEEFLETRRHKPSDAFIIGRITKDEPSEPAIALMEWLQELTNNLKSALQNIKNLQATDGQNLPVNFININTLDNNIASITQSISDINKVFE